MDHTSSLTELLSRARRRWLAHSLLDQFALAAAIGMGGVILLMLAGTQILDWYWVALLAVVSLGVGVYRLLQSVPSTYKLAQRIDHGLSLTDTLSTATYFSAKDAPGDELVRKRQREEAEAVARTVDVRQGVPFVRPRFLYLALGFGAIAFGLFALRYAMTGSLNLRPSLVTIALDTFFPQRQELAKNNAKKRPERAKQMQTDPDSPDQPNAQDELAQEQQQQQDQATSPDGTSPDDDQSQADMQNQTPDPNATDKDDKSDKGDTTSAGNDANQDQTGQDDNTNGGKEQNAKNNSNKGSDKENSSLINKVKDAMSDMWSKMTQKDAPQNSNSKSQQQNGQQDKSGQKNAQNQKSSQKSDQDSSGEQQQGEGGDQKQQASGASEKSSDANAQPDSKSGIGSSDGDKAAKEAAQLAAMGKISELLGKRAQNVTGEMMVEVGSSKQNLKTQWVQKQATHAEAGGEIHRDEIPLMYQQYVQQYLEEIRKPDSKPANSKPAPKPTKPS